LSFERDALCVKFPKGRSVKVRPDGTVVIKVPVLNCGPVDFDVSLDVRHTKGELLHVEYESSVTVEAGQLATIEATVHSEGGKPLSTKDITVAAKCEHVTERVWPRHRWRVPAAVLLALLLVAGAASFAAALHHRDSDKPAVVSVTSPPVTSPSVSSPVSSPPAATTPSTAPSTGAADQTSTPRSGTSVTIQGPVTSDTCTPVAFTATVTPAGGSAPLTGTVTFSATDPDGQTAAPMTTTLANDTANWEAMLGVGPNMITATYNGDAAHTGGTSAGYPFERGYCIK
jgi:hypothetical protein